MKTFVLDDKDAARLVDLLGGLNEHDQPGSAALWEALHDQYRLGSGDPVIQFDEPTAGTPVKGHPDVVALEALSEKYAAADEARRKASHALLDAQAHENEVVTAMNEVRRRIAMTIDCPVDEDIECSAKVGEACPAAFGYHLRRFIMAHKILKEQADG